MTGQPILSVKDLQVEFNSRFGPVRVVHGLDFSVKKSRTLGIVGESGCGKSMTALALMRLIPDPPGKITRGSISLSGEDLTKMSARQIRDVRGKKISMIFQEPMTALNPVFTVGDQISEILMRHSGMNRCEAFAKAEHILRQVQISDPERRLHEYPHQLSGGMRQRVMIAIAIACEPELLIADEPTTALDVTVQAQIFDLLREIQERSGMSMLLITHDFGVICEMADDVLVMYAGHKVEEGPVDSIVNNPYHPYTQGLLTCVPQLKEGRSDVITDLPEIPGTVPSVFEQTAGCPFAPRCSSAMPRCFEDLPPVFELESNRKVMCWLAEDICPEEKP